MTPLLTVMLACFSSGDRDAAHQANDVYQAILVDGVDFDGVRTRLDAPLLRDDQTPEEQKRKLAELAGGERALADLLRDSVTAPFVLKVRDEKTPHGLIRHAHLVFVIHTELASLDPAKAAREEIGKETEVANMKLATRVLGPKELEARKVVLRDPNSAWLLHSSAQMLDRIQVQTTNLVVVSRTENSLVVASKTDSRFGAEGDFPNVWKLLSKNGKPADGPQRYDGSVSYARFTRLAGTVETIVVECRIAYFEPNAWFDGAPILRSKFAPVAQDQIRRARRELKSPKK